MPDGLQDLTYSASALEKLARRLDDYIAQAEAFRNDQWANDHATFWQMYYAQPRNRIATYPWRGASNIFFPLGRASIDGIVAQKYDSLYTNDPVGKIVGIESDDVQDAELMTTYYFEHVYKKVIHKKQIGADFQLNQSVDGTACMIARWERKLRTRIDYRVTQEPIYQTDTTEFLGAEVKTRRITGYREKAFEDFIVEPEDKPVVDVVDVDKLYFCPDTGHSLQPEHCPWYYVSFEWNESDLRSRKKRQGYDFGTAAEFEAIVARLGQRNLGQVETAKRLGSGLSVSESDKTVKGCEFYMPLVLPGKYKVEDEIVNQTADSDDGYTIECIVTYLPEARKVVRIVPTQRIYPHTIGRPHRLTQYVRIPGFPYGIGVAHRSRQMNKFINQMGNQMIDYGLLTNLPFFFYQPAITGLLPDMTAISPGQGIPTSGDPRGIHQFNMRSDPGFFQIAMNMGLQWNERDTSINDFNLGRGRSGPSAPNTARATMAMLNQGQLMFGRLVAQDAEAEEQLMRDVHDLHRRYAKDQIFQVTGKEFGNNPKFRVPAKAFDQDVDFNFVANPNRSFDQQQNERMLAIIGKLPMTANNPDIMLEVLREYFISMGKQQLVDPVQKIKVMMTQQAEQAQQQQQAGPQGGQGQPPGMPMQGQGMMGQGAPPMMGQGPQMPMLPGASNVVPFAPPPTERKIAEPEDEVVNLG